VDPSVLQRAGHWRAAVSICIVFWLQFAWVSPTNFNGYDEWLNLSLTSRGILAFPYANRPLALLWNVPTTWLGTDLVTAHYLLHGLYLSLTGVLAYLIVRRLAPNAPLLAWLAGTFAATWAPRDFLRLDSVQMLLYGGFMAATLCSLLLLAGSWRPGRAWLLAPAVALAFCALRTYEGCLPLLVAAPPALAAVSQPQPRWHWALAWYSALVVGIAQMLGWWGDGTTSLAYQSMISRDLDLLPLAKRLIQHFGFSADPLIRPTWQELAVPRVMPALIAFAAGLAWAVPADPLSAQTRRTYAWAVGIGLLLAGLGWAPFAISPQLTSPDRTQFLPAPGMGLALAGAILWLASFLPHRWRMVGVAALAGWVMWVGTARILAMQRQWDERSAFPAQAEFLRHLTRWAPDLRSNTLVVLFDDTATWGAIAFRHAVEYLYENRACGYLWGSRNMLYRIDVTPAGVVYVTGVDIRRAWQSPPTLHRPHEIVFVRYGSNRSVTVLDHWPESFPLSAPAVYAPRARVVTARPAPKARAVLH